MLFSIIFVTEQRYFLLYLTLLLIIENVKDLRIEINMSPECEVGRAEPLRQPFIQ